MENIVTGINKKVFVTGMVMIILLTVTEAAGAQSIARLDFTPEAIFTASNDDYSVDEDNMDSFNVTSPTATIHNILGYTTVAMGLLTGILNPGLVGEDVHLALGYSSSALAAATLGFGFISHIKDIDLTSGLNSNNIHMILGIAGGSMMIIAPFLAPGDAHKVLGELGTLTMGVSIVGKLVF